MSRQVFSVRARVRCRVRVGARTPYHAVRERQNAPYAAEDGYAASRSLYRPPAGRREALRKMFSAAVLQQARRVCAVTRMW